MSGGLWLSSVLDPEMEHWPAALPKVEQLSPANLLPLSFALFLSAEDTALLFSPGQHWLMPVSALGSQHL